MSKPEMPAGPGSTATMATAVKKLDRASHLSLAYPPCVPPKPSFSKLVGTAAPFVACRRPEAKGSQAAGGLAKAVPELK